jgi:hypothetical protein
MVMQLFFAIEWLFCSAEPTVYLERLPFGLVLRLYNGHPRPWLSTWRLILAMVSQRLGKLAILSVLIWTSIPLAWSITLSPSSTGLSTTHSASFLASSSVDTLTPRPASSSAQISSSDISAPSSGLSTPSSSLSTPASSSASGVASGFVPLPIPSQAPVPGVFPSTNPKLPPPTDESTQIVPDFSPAWAAAYAKAKAKVTTAPRVTPKIQTHPLL